MGSTNYATIASSIIKELIRLHNDRIIMFPILNAHIKHTTRVRNGPLVHVINRRYERNIVFFEEKTKYSLTDDTNRPTKSAQDE